MKEVSANKENEGPLLKVFFLTLSFLAGSLLPCQGSLNATLLDPTNSQIAPAAISFFIGSLALACAYCYDPRNNKEAKTESPGFWQLVKTASWASLFIPGVIGSFYVTLAAVLGRKLGFSLFFVCIVTGNLFSAAVTDHFGAFGLAVRRITLVRILCMLTVLLGSGISVFERIRDSNSSRELPLWKSLVFIAMSLFSGSLFSIQVALNTALTTHMQSLAHRITLWSFSTGTVFLIIATLLSTLLPSVPPVEMSTLKELPLWKFLGGPLGATYVFLSVYLGPRIGVSFFLVFAIGGQLFTSLIIDNFGLLESTEIPATIARVLGILIVFIALVCFRFEDKIQDIIGKKESTQEEVIKEDDDPKQTDTRDLNLN